MQLAAERPIFKYDEGFFMVSHKSDAAVCTVTKVDFVFQYFAIVVVLNLKLG